MQDKKQVIGLILSVVLSVGLVVIGVNAATTVGNDVSIGGALSISATTTALGSVILENTADLTVGSATSTFAGDVSLGDGQGDNIRINGTVSSATTTLLSIGGGQMISKNLFSSGTIDFPALGIYDKCSSSTIAVPGAVAGDVVYLGVPTGVFNSLSVYWNAVVSSADTVSVIVCNASTATTSDIASGVFKVAVLQH